MRDSFNNRIVRDLNKPVEMWGARPITIMVGGIALLLSFLLGFVIVLFVFAIVAGIAIFEKRELEKGNESAMQELLGGNKIPDYVEDENTVAKMMDNEA